MHRRYCGVLAALALVAAMVAAMIPHVTADAAAGAPIRGHAARAAGCAATGTYRVGLRTPETKAQTRPSASLRQARAGVRPASISQPVVPGMRGTITLSTYTGCGGQTTTGSFSVARLASSSGPLPAPQGSASIACRAPCPSTSIGMVKATGTFSQDPLHEGDVIYIRVDATITTAYPGPRQGRPCSTRTGCPPQGVITSTVTMTNVTGYLQVFNGQSVQLAFLQPPSGGRAPALIQINGYRGGMQPY